VKKKEEKMSGTDNPPTYARALQQARQEVRKRPGWQAPFYWAPFVLVGPAE